MSIKQCSVKWYTLLGIFYINVAKYLICKQNGHNTAIESINTILYELLIAAIVSKGVHFYTQNIILLVNIHVVVQQAIPVHG